MSKPTICMCGHEGTLTESSRCRRCGQVVPPEPASMTPSPGQLVELLVAPGPLSCSRMYDPRTGLVYGRRYNANPSAAPDFGGEPFPGIPAYVKDARGEYVGPVIACDLDTGEVVAFMRGEDGRIRIHNDKPLTCRLQFQPPLTVTLDFSA